ncbi:MAG: hypothetical protein HY420_01180 [Candidatus Kerfeldbacteria bacterium]|nr:hypothetical protein [Candidatus Kerfeldbacteria bacterium]
MNWRQEMRNTIEEHIPLSGWRERIKGFIRLEGGSILVMAACISIGLLGAAVRGSLPARLLVVPFLIGIFGLGALLTMSKELMVTIMFHRPDDPGWLKKAASLFFEALDWLLVFSVAALTVSSGQFWWLFLAAGIVSARFRRKLWRAWRHCETIELSGATAKPIE